MSTLDLSHTFYVGQDVVCINDAFPLLTTTLEDKQNVGKQAEWHPMLNEKLTIDEMLGDFLRFQKYDIGDHCQWWHKSRFIAYAEKRLIEVIEENKNTLENV